MDTLSTATQLESAGFPIPQARAIVEAIFKSQKPLVKEEKMEQLMSEVKATNTKMETHLVTKDELRSERDELKSEMLKMELRLTRWFIGIVIAVVANLVTGILVLLQLFL